MGDRLVDQFRALEESLLSPQVRESRERLTSLIADDFVEFGVSGRIFGKQDVLDSAGSLPCVVTPLDDLDAIRLAENTVLVTYRSTTLLPDGGQLVALRGSVWQRIGEAWCLRFHQGTRVSRSA